MFISVKVGTISLYIYVSGIIFGNNSPQPMVNCQVNIIAATEMTNGLKTLPTRNCPLHNDCRAKEKLEN